MSANPCLNAAEGDFMAWPRMTWNMTGEGMKKMNLSEDETNDAQEQLQEQCCSKSQHKGNIYLKNLCMYYSNFR